MAEEQDGQVSRGAAMVYEAFFVPALFRQWAPLVADAAGLGPGQRVLDVACGTGVLAREAAGRMMQDGSVTGLDRNAGMLAVAAGSAPEITWQVGMAERLPFPDQAFDAVVSQFGLMFFDDRLAALQEMWRVLRRPGRLAVAVWAPLEQSPGYAAMAGLLERLFGRSVADELRAPFVLGELAGLRSLFAAASIPLDGIQTKEGTARFASIEAWVHTEIKGWTLADRIDDRQYHLLLASSERELRRFAGADGSVAFPVPAHIAVATKR